MTVSKTFRFKNIEDRLYFDEIVNKVADRFKGEINIKGDALVKLGNLYDEGTSDKDFDELPSSIQETIRLCDCEFVQWSQLTGFVCYETYHKDRKTKLIGGEHKRVVSACALCKVGRATAIQRSIEASFRKKGVTSFVKLINDLIRIDTEGAVAQIFLCQGKRFTDDELYLSPDCVHFKCPEMDDELIEIDEWCVKQTNPFTMEPPCRYLVAPFLKVNIVVPDETRAIMDEVKELEAKEEIQEPIEVDAEYKVVESEPEIETEPIEEIEHEPVDLDNPQTARDIIEKENREKEQAKLIEKEEDNGGESEP